LSPERLALELAGPIGGVRVVASGVEAVDAARLTCARAEGERLGRAEAGAALDAAVARLAAVEEEARTALAGTAVDLALEIARTLLRGEIQRDRHDLERIVRATLAEAVTGRAPCVVHLHPSDHARLSETKFRSGTRIEPDTGVAKGDVHVETSLGLLVRDLDGTLAAIGRRLKEELT
jgi:flagellar biosynthesis/type III secretory pathway protein FliH